MPFQVSEVELEIIVEPVILHSIAAVAVAMVHSRAEVVDLSWGDSQEEIVFLGEWCKRYSMKNLWSSREHRAIDYHWANRKKLAIDHTYLEALNEKLLKFIQI